LGILPDISIWYRFKGLILLASIALLLYRMSVILLTPMLLLLLLLRSRSQVAYRHRLPERFGWLTSRFVPGGIVIHAASVGEVIALRAFIEQCLQHFPQLMITVTTFTPTGSRQVQQLFAHALAQGQLQHCYLPLDIWCCSALFLNKLKPKALVLMETELWPNLIAQCQHRAIPLMLVNGRLSDTSVRQYQYLSWLINPAIAKFNAILAQSEQHRQRFLALGAPPAHCVNAGNLKYDIALTSALKQQCSALQQHIAANTVIWLVASTHEGDEAIVLAAFTEIKRQYPELLLLLVPRHPERFEHCYTLAQQAGFSVQRRTEHNMLRAKTDVWLLDTLGELSAAYGLAQVVTIGGSFNEVGGHNPLEPALWQKAIIVGSQMANFAEVQHQLLAAHAIKQLAADNPASLAKAVLELLSDEQQRAELGANAYQVVQANQGACARSISILTKLIGAN
jgi:3-deoxy-D-manno-octulosonic-acid transferase